MEKEEIREHIKYQFERIAEHEETKKELIKTAKDQILIVLKVFVPDIIEQDQEIKSRVNEIKLAALELKENYSCDFGRVHYYEPWLEEKEGVRIQGNKPKQDDFLVMDSFETVDKIVEGFLINLGAEESKGEETTNEGGDQN